MTTVSRPLFSLEAEHGVLGAMLLRNDLIDTLSTGLSQLDFSDADNAAIYGEILRLHNLSKPVDVITIADDMHTLPSGEGTIAFAGEIAMNTASVANAATYARIIIERSQERKLLSAGVAVQDIARGEGDINNKIAAAQAEILALDSSSDSSDLVMTADILRGQLEVWQERHDRLRNGEMIGLSTGLKDLDEKLSGLQPEQLIVIAGRPAMGKTTLGMNMIADAAIRQNKSAIVFSLEMSRDQLIDRLVASEGKVPLNMVKDGSACQTHGTELAAGSLLVKNAKIAICDRPSLTINAMRSIARKHKNTHGLDIVMIDYLQLMNGENQAGNRNEEISVISRNAKMLARELKVPVILLSQLNRALEQRPNKRPVNADLRDSGAIEQDADVILFVYRDEVYKPESDYKGTAEIIIGKQRDGEIGTVRTAFRGSVNRFEDLAAGWVEPEPEEKPKQYKKSAKKSLMESFNAP